MTAWLVYDEQRQQYVDFDQAEELVEQYKQRRQQQQRQQRAGAGAGSRDSSSSVEDISGEKLGPAPSGVGNGAQPSSSQQSTEQQETPQQQSSSPAAAYGV